MYIYGGRETKVMDGGTRVNSFDTRPAQKVIVEHLTRVEIILVE